MIFEDYEPVVLEPSPAGGYMFYKYNRFWRVEQKGGHCTLAVGTSSKSLTFTAKSIPALFKQSLLATVEELEELQENTHLLIAL